jgi:hypothetical protein
VRQVEISDAPVAFDAVPTGFSTFKKKLKKKLIKKTRATTTSHCKLTHLIHNSSFEDPFAVPYFPAPQSQQTEEEEPPTVVEYLPWSHF